MRIVTTSAVLTLALSLSAGCGSGDDAEVITDPYTGSPGLDQVASASPAADYPVGPYGVGIGDTVADATFFGFVNGEAANNHELSSIALHDFYDPDGTKGHTVMYASIAAVWCGPCGVETKDLPQIHADLESSGVVFFQDLYQGSNQQSGDPATQRDLEKWNKKYKLTFPTVIDPKGKLQAYFDRNGIPFSMLIDLRTMKILATTNGYGGIEELERFITSNIPR